MYCFLGDFTFSVLTVLHQYHLDIISCWWMWIGWIVGSGAIWSMLIIMGERLIVFSSLVDQLKTLLTGLLHITSVNLNQSAHAGYQ